MDKLELEFAIKSAFQVFVWLQLSPDRGFYVKTTKVALTEYLDAIEPFNEHIYIEFGEGNGELYLGRPSDIV